MGLVLGRKPGESIQIGDSIIFTVYKDDHGHIKMVFEAHREIVIIRHEIVPEHRRLPAPRVPL